MLKKCTFYLGAILLLTSAGFAAIGQTPCHTLVASGHTATVGHRQMAYSSYYCSAVGLQQQTCIVGCQYQVIRRFCWWPCEPPWKSPCRPRGEPPCKPPCEPPSGQPYIVKGGDASATAVSYGGIADPIAHAVGGDATVVIRCRPPSNQPYIVKGGDASATAISYGGNANATAEAIGGDAILVATCRPPSSQPYIVKGGDATATAISYGGGEATAHAVGGDAIVITK